MKVDVRNNNVDKAIRVLKKKLQQEGIFNELREREAFMSRGEKKRKAKAAAIRRNDKAMKKRIEEFVLNRPTPLRIRNKRESSFKPKRTRKKNRKKYVTASTKFIT